MDTLHHLPIAEIDPAALLRDRATLDEAALHQLELSIATEGLRLPIEVWQLATPDAASPCRYGLISGLRRLTACQGLGHTTIAAFLRPPPPSTARALAAMVTENEVREPVSPYEKAALVLNVVEAGHFPTADAAVATLFSSLPRTSANRIRNHVRVVEELGPLLATPHLLPTRHLDMIAAAIATGHEDLLTAVLEPVAKAGMATQWSTLRPVLEDVLREPTNPTTRRPRRLLKLPQGLTITREPTPTGWILRLTGPQTKKGGMVDDVMEHVERWFGKQ
jgi:ParB family chromosome partitioning protein